MVTVDKVRKCIIYKDGLGFNEVTDSFIFHYL
uniref:Uncharacterized protein n=1 Tax=Arundo donax TaxID=35708 RepID=A0A0A8YX10_ARUDO